MFFRLNIFNPIYFIQNDGKGVIIAEGDVLTLCIRLFSELLQGHFEIALPDPSATVSAIPANCPIVCASSSSHLLTIYAALATLAARLLLLGHASAAFSGGP